MKYTYDSIYPYETFLKEVKDLIFPTIIEMINLDDVKNTQLSKEAYAEVIYTHIMALGYNEGNLQAAFNDIFSSRNFVFYPETDESDAAAKMLINLAGIEKEYKHQVWAFQSFHKGTQQLRSHKEVLIEVKKHLLAIQMGL